MTGPAEAVLLTAVERSPQAAAAHDRAGWVGLFTADGSVEDPVGSQPHTGSTEIGRFYDTFIGPRDITFHRDLDVVRGTSVVRDLDLDLRSRFRSRLVAGAPSYSPTRPGRVAGLSGCAASHSDAAQEHHSRIDYERITSPSLQAGDHHEHQPRSRHDL